MEEYIIKPGIVKRVTDKLKDTKIVVGGGKEWRKRRYNLKYTQDIVDNVITAFMDIITEAIENGDTVKLNGYMSIKPRFCKETKGRNVYNNKEVIIPAQYRAKIIPGSKLDKACKILSERELGKSDEEMNE